jgi:hypothetical protein
MFSSWVVSMYHSAIDQHRKRTEDDGLGMSKVASGINAAMLVVENCESHAGTVSGLRA